MRLVIRVMTKKPDLCPVGYVSHPSCDIITLCDDEWYQFLEADKRERIDMISDILGLSYIYDLIEEISWFPLDKQDKIGVIDYQYSSIPPVEKTTSFNDLTSEQRLKMIDRWRKEYENMTPAEKEAYNDLVEAECSGFK